MRECRAGWSATLRGHAPRSPRYARQV